MAKSIKKFVYRPASRPQFKRLLRHAYSVVLIRAHAEALLFMHRHASQFVQNIYDQAFKSFVDNPLSESWLSKKLDAGVDLRVGIATGTYTDSIQVLAKDDGRRPGTGTTTYCVGFDAADVAVKLDGRPTDLPLYVLAGILEFGSASAHVPARPHWRPYFKVMRKDAPELRRTIAVGAVKLVRAALRSPTRITTGDLAALSDGVLALRKKVIG